MALVQLYAGDFITPAVRLVRLLAEGGMGKVWIAHHIGLDARVVVKVMSEQMAVRADGRERFAREAAAAAAIKSPHVVQVFDHGVTDSGVPYIVMELLEGKDLAAYLTDDGRLAPHDALLLVVQIGKALSRAHRAGIVHRDIKPENIFLCDTGESPLGSKEIHVKLLDFGTAKRRTGTPTLRGIEDDLSSAASGAPSPVGATAPGLIMGTPFYMSPEQSIGSDVDGRTDIWSLGVVAFEALTGERPFGGTSVGAITIAIHGALPRMTDIVPELPPALDDWFARACARLPADRFPTVRSAIDAFIEAVTGDRPGDLATESLFFPLSKAGSKLMPPEDGVKLGVSPSVAPITTPITPLSASLPERGSRATTLAAGGVAVLAAVAMLAIVFSSGRNSPDAHASSSPPVQAAPPPSPEAPPPPPAAAPADVAPPALAAVPEEPEPSLPPRARRSVAASPATPGKRAQVSVRPRSVASPPASPSPPAAKAPSASGAANDDDLIRLQNVASKHAETPAPAATPAPEAASPPPQPAPPPPATGNEPPPLPPSP